MTSQPFPSACLLLLYASQTPLRSVRTVHKRSHSTKCQRADNFTVKGSEIWSLACLGEPLGPESQPGAMLPHTCLLASLVASLLEYRWKEPDG